MMTEVDAPGSGGIPRLARVLVTTDLSSLGDLAVRWAYALAGRDGIVHLAHVIDPVSVPNPLYAHYRPGHTPTQEQRTAQARAVHERLSELVPREAKRARISTRIEVLEENDVVQAICEAAERLDVDAICMASHGHTGLTRVLLGSVAQSVLERSRRPVLIVRPEAS